MDPLTLIAKAAPSGGAAIGETIAATTGAAVITAVMFAIVAGHRSGRLPPSARRASPPGPRCRSSSWSAPS